MKIQNLKYELLIDDEDYQIIKEHKIGFEKCANKIYARFSKNKTDYRLHRFLANPPDGYCVDHINGNTLDNRRSNLRICTKSENNFNKSIQCDNKTGYKGVTFDAQTTSKNKYRLEFWYKNKRILRKRFGSPIEAAKEYDKLALEYYGKFANLNFPHYELLEK